MAVFCFGLEAKPGIPEVDFVGGYIDDEAAEREFLIIPLEAVGVLPESAEIGFNDVSDLLFGEGLLIESSFGDLVFESVVVLPLKDEEVDLLVGAVAFVVEVMGMFEGGDGLTLSVGVLLEDMLHLVGVGF